MTQRPRDERLTDITVALATRGAGVPQRGQTPVASAVTMILHRRHRKWDALRGRAGTAGRASGVTRRGGGCEPVANETRAGGGTSPGAGTATGGRSSPA